MKKQILTLVACMGGTWVMAQSADRQVTGSAGGAFTNAAFAVDYTVGEGVIGAGTTGTFTVSQGFQQMTENNASGIQDRLIRAEYRLFPNPAQSRVTLVIDSDGGFDMRLSLCNAAGQSLYSDAHAEAVPPHYTREIPVQSLAAGIYFINLHDKDRKLLQSIRLIKQ